MFKFLVATGSSDQINQDTRIRIWNEENGKELITINNDKPVCSIEHINNSIIATGN